MNNDQAHTDDGAPADESHLKAALRPLDSDAPAADENFLAALRQRTLEVFSQQQDTTDSTLLPRPIPMARKPNWLRRWAALAATAAVVAISVVLLTHNPVSGAPQFSKVLDDLHSAKTLELKVTKDGHTADVWVQSLALVRWEDSPQRYRIASGSRLWQIDESTNTAVAADSPWLVQPHEQIDLLSLLEVGVSDSSRLLTAQASGYQQYGGHDCYVYHVEVPAPHGPLNVEAYVDAKLNHLLGIVARPQGAPTVGPPLAELQLVAINGPVDESKFVVAKTLTEDGRIGKIVDLQGLVQLRPALAQRWTPINSEMLLQTGDWLRTDIRGPNAVKIRLSSAVELTLGPGSLLELISPTQARLHTGEVQYDFPHHDSQHPEEGLTFVLLGPQQESHKLGDAGKQLWRINADEKLVEEKERPQWLAGFEGTSSNESLGSLIVNLPDHPNEPLEVGYHKVSVEIRDQIARTTIEESFVNHTQTRLEGTFYFPLPQDASISDFGMWIGNELVEADIVEKQRAREIYETILREKRDPGLLEWTSGNLFKARVFPIEAQAEKRIKIVYTQVLPLRGNKYRYTYGLRSELLASHPLRELNLSVQVNSALPLKSVTCPTHPVRRELTEHSAQVDFTAQDYTPTRDFEVVCEVESRNSDVVVVPHRRGDDGYFLLQLMPPGSDGNFQREVISDGKPLHVVLLCDTSASMDAEKRKQQSEFVATVLSSLGEKDQFQLAAADVATEWVSPEAMSPTAENIAKVREFLDKRVSLGWTDLDQAFAAVLKQSPPDAQIVYVGDGIVTAGETDPASFVKRLGRMIAAGPGDASAKPRADNSTSGRTFHAVMVGNTYEAIVLNGIAVVGHGSLRSIGGERTPQIVAAELLNELTQPSLRDVKVEFRGLQVAAVYPEQVPSLPAGTQQILVGRYLPTGADQQGEVIVTAKRGEETVRYAAKINLKDAEEGNSFIPRLWARKQLDHLLQQGPSEAIHDQIIALSEEFHIITPYTSLLVLESDADRQRFGVKKRFTMRDGERFFAQGRENANFELLAQQMKLASNWRLQLRYQVLSELAGLGRNPQMLQQQLQMLGNNGDNWSRSLRLAGNNTYGGETMIAGGTLLGINRPMDGEVPAFGPLSSSSVVGLDATGYAGIDRSNAMFWQQHGGRFGGGGGGFGGSNVNRRSLNGEVEDNGLLGYDGDATDGLSADVGQPLSEMLADKDQSGLSLDALKRDFNRSMAGEIENNSFSTPASDMPMAAALPWAQNAASNDMKQLGLSSYASLSRGTMDFFPYEQKTRDIGYTIAKPIYEFGRMPYWQQQQYTGWLDTLFPALASPPAKPTPEKESVGWSAEAIALSKSLLRSESLEKLQGGIEITRTNETFDVRWNRRTGKNSDLMLYSPTAWLTRSLNPSSHIVVDYCDEKERLVFSQALLLGRTRKSLDRDLKTLPIGWGDYSLTALHQQYGGDQVKVKLEPAGENRTTLTITFTNSKEEFRFLIDTARHVLLKQETLSDGKLTGTYEFSNFIEVGGSWWPQQIVTSDEKGQKTGETTLEVKLLAPDTYSARIQTELTSRAQVQFLHIPGVPLKAARQRVADGSADFNDRVTIMLNACVLQQWDELLVQLDAAEKLATDKPGVRWLRTVLLTTIGRNEEARQRLLAEAHKLAADKQSHDVFLTDFVLDRAQGIMSPQEYLELVQQLEPVYTRTSDADLKAHWQQRLLGCYESLQRTKEALALRRTLAEQSPWDINQQIEYARRLLQNGQTQAAYDWVQKELDRPIAWTDSEDATLRGALADFYRTQLRWEDLLQYTTEWIKRNPHYEQAYQQHLSALIYNNQLETAKVLAKQWLQEGEIAGEFAPDQQAQLSTAIGFMQGNSWSLQFDQNEQAFAWAETLAKAAQFFAQQNNHFDIANRITGSGYFWNYEPADRFRGFVLGQLKTNLDALTPAQISSFVGWALSGRMELPEPLDGRAQLDAAEITNELWETIAEQIHERWLHTEDLDDKSSLGESLRTIYSSRFPDSKLLPFLREQIAAAPKERKAGCTAMLFDALITHNWTAEKEQEAFELWPQLSDAEEPGPRLAVEVPALLRLVDAMIAGRQAHDMQTLHDQGKIDQLTRTELQNKQAEFAKAAKTALEKKLGAEADAIENTNKSNPQKLPLLPWLRMEQAYLDVQLDQNLSQVEEFCWKILGETPPKPKDAPAEDAVQEEVDTAPAQWQAEALDAVLRQRAFITAMNLAARRGAQPATIDRTLKYIDAGIDQKNVLLPTWRAMKFQLLVALDRPDDLEQQLRAWVRSDETTTPWRKALALLLAERGKLDEAITLFEAAEKYQMLSGPDYRTLANWYLVKNRRDDYDRCRLEAFKQTPEQLLSNMLWAVRNRWMQPNPPLTELDDNTLLAVRALLEKTAQPTNYFWQLNQLYTATRDFRLLQIIPYGTLGRTPEQIYPYLQGIQGQILNDVHGEATNDEIISQIKKLREGKLTSADQRALDLLEALVERRSAEVLNQPGPHADACVAALKRAFDRPWGTGEPLMMAGFLRGLGTLPRPAMVDEQLRELRALQAQTAASSRDHLLITNDLCNLLFWSYSKHEEAIESMQAEVRSYDQAQHGVWPNQDNNVLGDYVHLYEGAVRHADGEAVLRQYLAVPENDQQRQWLGKRLLELYNDALDHDGEVSLGKGQTLFTNLLAQELKQLDQASDENIRQELVTRVCGTFEIAHRHHFSGVEQELKAFAFETLPGVLKLQQTQYQNTATAPQGVIRDVLGLQAALRYTIERMEQYPPWLVIGYNKVWNAFGWQLAQQRDEAVRQNVNIQDLNPRILKLVLAELKRDLESRQAYNRVIYSINNTYFWSEKADDFARAADEVYAEAKASGRSVQYVANYLWNDLHRFSRAIEILLIAQQQGLLDEGMQEQLVDYLQQQNRHAESIAILEPLLKVHPDTMHYRAQLMAAYFHTQRPDQLTELVRNTDEHFHQGGRWTEGNIAELGRACLDCQLYEKAVGYLNEGISLHQRANGSMVANDGWLSEQYQRLADAQSALGHTQAAVDAAAAAIVCWSNLRNERQTVLNKLREVMKAAKDLPAFAEGLDQETAKNGQDSPILRKALGQVFQSQGEYRQAVKQLQIAVQLQPNDKELYQALLECYDHLEDKAEATRQLLQLIAVDPHNLPLYEKLAERLKDQPAEAERAITSLIEVGPQEAENHTKLAEYRQGQNRWDEAIDQWSDVAKLRALEPTGLIQLATAQIHQHQWDAAQETIKKLQRTSWPGRFGDMDNQIRSLEQQLPKQEKK